MYDDKRVLATSTSCETTDECDSSYHPDTTGDRLYSLDMQSQSSRFLIRSPCPAPFLILIPNVKIIT